MNKEEPQIFTRWIDPTINEYKQQIDQLTNNWNELEEYIKDLPNNEYVGYLKSDILDKMKEIKEGKNDRTSIIE